MENTPNTEQALRQHFSQRASAARIAWRKLTRKEPLPPLTDEPLSVQPANPHHGEVPHR